MDQIQEKARGHPVIAGFSALAKGHFIEGAIDFPVLQTPDLPQHAKRNGNNNTILQPLKDLI